LCRYTVADNAGNVAKPVFRNVVVISPCPEPEVWCTSQSACSFQNICSNVASVLAGLGSADRQPNSRTNDYEEPGNVDVVAVIDEDPPYIRVEKILVRPSSVLFSLCAADQW
jgi:hypothetical protein